MDTEVEVLRLRELRKGMGLGLEKCSRRADINVRTLIQYEQGRSRPGIVNAAKIARGLGVQIGEVAELRSALQEIEDLGYTLVKTHCNRKEEA
jgi:transcriptional regulator with XRE-family HTH domain